MIDSFLRYIEFEKRYSPNTVISYHTDLSQFSFFLNEQCDIQKIQEADFSVIRSWLVNLMEHYLDARSVNRKIASLKSFYNFLLKQGYISSNPTLKIRAPKVKKRLPVFIEESSMHDLLENLTFPEDFFGIRDKLIIELLYGTGMRLSELINLNISDVNMHEKTLKVIGKGNKERIIPFHNNIYEILIVYNNYKGITFLNNQETSLVLTDKGEKSYPMFIQKVVKKYLSQVSTSDKKSPHILRHSFATHLLNNGADLNAIKELMGHASLAATQVYTHNSLEKLKTIFKQAHPKA